MSSTPQPRDRRVRRKINPATASVEELLTHLATDPAAGLSPKEAERRLNASAAKPLYASHARSFADCVKADKKGDGDAVNFVLLKSVGEPCVRRIEYQTLKNYLNKIYANHN